MTREPVAFDFIGVESAHGKLAYGSTTTTLVRPIPSVRESHLVGPLSTSRMSFVPEGVQTRDNKRDNGFFSRPRGICRPPWVNKHVMAGRLQAEENFGTTVETSLKKEGVEHSPGSPSHHTILRNVAQMPPLGEESQLGAHQSTLAGTEPSSVTHQNPSSSYSPGFGSPLYNRMKDNGVPIANQNLPNLQQQLQAAAHALARPPGTGKNPHLAQLTIFYAGMVNVYDDVPFDKAQAIMLLAGTGNAWSSNYMNLPGASGRPFSTPISQPSQPTSRAGSPTLQMAKTPSATAPSPVVPIAINRQMPTTTTGLIACAVELPQARKASLARFLEKRKDRVRKRPYTDPRNEDLARNSREHSPCPPSSSTKPLARPLSPPLVKNQSNVPMFAGGASTSGSGPGSPPRQGMSEDQRSSHGMPGKLKEIETSMETMAARRGKSSPPPSSSPSLSPSRGVAVVASNRRAEPMDHEHLS